MARYANALWGLGSRVWRLGAGTWGLASGPRPQTLDPRPKFWSVAASLPGYAQPREDPRLVAERRFDTAGDQCPAVAEWFH